MGHRGFSGVRLHIFCILLRSHAVLGKKFPKGHRVGQIQRQGRSRRRCGRYGAEADIFFLHPGLH